MRVDVYIVLCRARVITKLEMCICVRTIARIWQHVDKENEEQVPKIPTQTSLCTLAHVGELLCACLCRGLLCLSTSNYCMRKRVRAWLPTHKHFAVLSCRPETSESQAWCVGGGVLSNLFLCISMFRRLQIRAHTRRCSSVAGALALLNTRDIALSCRGRVRK